MDNIIPFNGHTTLDIDPEKVIDGASGKLSCVIVIGIEHDGANYYASSSGDMAKNILMIERFKFKCLNGDFE